MNVSLQKLLTAIAFLTLPALSGCIGCGNELPRPAGRAARSESPAAASQDPGSAPVSVAPDRRGGGPTVVKMRRENGVYKVPVRINGVEMEFIFDTGASAVSISNLEASYLVKQGKVSREDVEGSAQFLDATGNVSEGTILNLKEVNIGDRTAHNVKASVVDNTIAPLLLGQTFLEQFGSIRIDYKSGTITFE